MSSSTSNESASKKGVLAGATLTVIEVTGGFVSGSLGLLSSSFNTLMDFLASIIMFFAVRESSKPPDEVHMYGHEKVESIAAVSEILLLFLTCSWIVYNAFLRIIANQQTIGLFWVAFLTNFASITIDLLAYTKLKSSTKKQKSEAVEAGALHFLNDFLIAVIVIIGLIFYNLGVWIADSIAALCIVAYILYSGIRMLRIPYATLIDAAPPGISEKVKNQILTVDGVKDCHYLRIRRAGQKNFVDAHVTLSGGMTLYQAHSITSTIEERISKILPNSDILIHTEPYSGKDVVTKIRAIASDVSEIRDVHGISVKTINGELFISYHIELDPKITIAAAHEIADRLERLLKDKLPKVSTIISHLEPSSEISGTEYSHKSTVFLEKEIQKISLSIPEVHSLHELEILVRDGKYNVTVHCEIDSSITLTRAHEIATKIEEKIRSIDNRVNQVSVHCEPQTRN